MYVMYEINQSIINKYSPPTKRFSVFVLSGAGKPPKTEDQQTKTKKFAMMKHSGKNKLNLKLPAMDSNTQGQQHPESDDKQPYTNSAVGNTGGGNGGTQNSSSLTMCSTTLSGLASSTGHHFAPQHQNRHRYSLSQN